MRSTVGADDGDRDIEDSSGIADDCDLDRDFSSRTSALVVGCVPCLFTSPAFIIFLTGGGGTGCLSSGGTSANRFGMEGGARIRCVGVAVNSFILISDIALSSSDFVGDGDRVSDRGGSGGTGVY